MLTKSIEISKSLQKRGFNDYTGVTDYEDGTVNNMNVCYCLRLKSKLTFPQIEGSNHVARANEAPSIYNVEYCMDIFGPSGLLM